MQKIIRAGFLYFAFVLGTGFVLGSFRVPFLVPRLGERYVQAGPGTIQQMEANLDAVAVSNAWEVAAAASEPGRPAQLVPTIG